MLMHIVRPSLAAIAILAAGCQSGVVSRSAPAPSQLYSGTITPLTGPVEVTPASAFGLGYSAQLTGSVSYFDESRSVRDNLSGTMNVDYVPGDRVTVRLDILSVSADYSDELPDGPFTYIYEVDLKREQISTDMIRSDGRPFSASELRAADGTMADLVPVRGWAAGTMTQGATVGTLTINSVGSGGSVTASTTDVPLTVLGQTTHQGRPAIVIGLGTRIDGPSDGSSISGYYVVDQQTAIILERKWHTASADYGNVTGYVHAGRFLYDSTTITRVQF